MNREPMLHPAGFNVVRKENASWDEGEKEGMRVIETREKTSKATLLLVYLIGFCFLWEQCKRISFPSSSDFLSWIRLMDLILLGAVLFKLFYRDHRWYFILILAVILIILTSWVRSPSVLSKTRSNFSKITMVLLLCPAVGILAQGRSLKTFFQVLTAVWTIINVALCIMAIYALCNNIQIISYNGTRIIGLDKERCLLLWDSYRNTSGVLLALSIMTAYVGAAISEKRWVFALYLVAAFLMLVCLAMTGCRSGIISMCAGSGIAFAAIIQKRLGSRIGRKWLKWLITLLLAIAVAAVCLVGTEGVRRGFNSILQRGDVLVSSAEAEEEIIQEDETPETESGNIAERDYFSGSLSGREDLWRNTLEALKMKPSLILTGTSIHTVMEDLSGMVETYGLPQLHNEFLQVLVSTGILGVILFVAFIILAFRAALRLFTDSERPLWERLMFLPFLCLFLIDLVESIGINAHTDLNGLVMIFTGAAIEIAGKEKTERSTSEDF